MKIIIGLLLFGSALSLTLYYTKSIRERERETSTEIFLRSVLPSIFFCIVALGIIVNYTRFRLPFTIFPEEKVVLNERYFD